MPATPSSKPTAHKVAVYASVGPALHHYEVNVDTCSLQKTPAVVSAPDNIQYGWPDAAGAHLYVVSSNVSKYVSPSASSHHRIAFRIQPDSAALEPYGAPLPLPWRPVHVTLDASGKHEIVVYPSPARATVHRILEEGQIADDVAQQDDLDTGVFPHQVRMMPSGKSVIIVTRGNNAEAGKPEDPGALKVFSYRDGVLSNRASIAPNGGYGFGPRHIDFDPSGRWLFAALERQNKLQVFSINDDAISATPLFDRDTLANPGNPMGHQQMVGTVHVHPSGRFVYVANRCSATTSIEGRNVATGGENSISVFSVNPQSGEPTLIQHADLHSIHVRTFAIDPSGRMLVAASISAMSVRDASGATTLPARLTTYRIGSDGKLSFVTHYDVDTGPDRRMFWMGMVASAR